MGHSGTQFAKYQAAAGDSLGGGFNFWCSTYLIITRFLVRAQVSAIQVSNMQFWGTPLLPRNSSGCSVGFVFAPSESRRPSLSRTLRTKHFPVSDLAHGRSGAQVKSFGLISADPLGEVLVVQDVLSNQFDLMILTLLHSGDEMLTLFEVIQLVHKWTVQISSIWNAVRPIVRTCESPF